MKSTAQNKFDFGGTMKKKKILIAIFCFSLAICLAGCGETNTAKAIATGIDKKTQKLEAVVASMEDINYNDIVISEISPLEDQTFNTVSTGNSLSKKKWYTIGGASQSATKTSTVVDGNKKFPNARYVSQNSGDKIGLPNYENNYRNTVKKLSLPTTSNGQNSSSYRPKYVNDVSNSFSRNKVDEYLKKIEVIYNDCADCVSCNAECRAEKSRMQQNISSCRTLSTKLKDGTITLTGSEIKDCNSCLTNLTDCATRLNSTKSNVKSKQQTIMSLKNNFATKIDEIDKAYTKLLEALENRLDCLQQCNKNLNCICDIINRSNVDMTDALNNKTNQTEIKDYSNESLPDSNAQDNTINTDTNDSVNQLPNQNTPIMTENDDTNSSQNNQSWTQNNRDTHSLLDNGNKTQLSQNNVYPQNTIQNTYETNNKNSNGKTNIDTMNTPSTNKNDYVKPNQNQLNQPNFQNSESALTNGANYAQNGTYQNAYNNGYSANGYYGNNGFYGNNRPYAPRNIDTYRTIYKNIDTYAPYRNGTNSNGIAQKNIVQTQDNQADKNQNDDGNDNNEVTQNKQNNNLQQKKVAPLPSPFEQRQVEENQKKIKESKQTPDGKKNLNSTSKNTENTSNNTATMQNQN